MFLVLSLCLLQIEGARILAVFPIPSISHQVVFRPLTQELANRGHHVVVLTTDPAFPDGLTPPNLTEIDLHNISYSFWRANYKVSEKGWKDDPAAHMKHAHEIFSKVTEVLLLTEGMQKMIEEDDFDLVIVEAPCRPAYVLAHIFKAPMILVSSAGAGTGLYNIVGAPTHPILYPSIVRLRIHNLTLYEKLAEMYNHFLYTKHYEEVDEMVDGILKRIFGPTVPSIDSLKDKVDMIFLNIHPVLEGNYPVPPNVIHVWGLHEKVDKKLPDDLKLFLDNSKHGVIYMSFGTNVNPSMLPKKKLKTILKVLSKFQYDVLWKWNGVEDKDLPENIKIEKWFPQNDLLKHPKVKLFITQGGLQSTDEAVTAGVPMIGIPIAADQWFNTEKYVHHGIGLQLDLETMTEDKLHNALRTILEDDSYRHNIRNLNDLMRDEPMPALERAVWWVEHVLRHGGARHLRSPAANISWVQYLELELVTLLVLALVISIAPVLLLVKFVKKILFSIKIKTD